VEETGLRTINLLFFLLLTYLTFLNTPFVVGVPPSLNLTIATNKSIYLQGERVEISGTLRVEEVNPIPKWPIAISIRFPDGTTLLHATPNTTQNGNFAMTFNLPPETESGTYAVLSSVLWNDQYAMKEITFEIKPTGQVGVVQPQVSHGPKPFSPVLLTLIATVVAFILIFSALIFYGLVTFQKKVEAPVAPVTPITPVRKLDKVDMVRYKTCVKCGRTFLGIHTFCPYCFTYHGKNGYTEKTTA